MNATHHQHSCLNHIWLKLNIFYTVHEHLLAFQLCKNCTLVSTSTHMHIPSKRNTIRLEAHLLSKENEIKQMKTTENRIIITKL